MIPNVDTKLGIVVHDRLCFGVDGATSGEDRQMITCKVVHMLCLVQASFGIHFELVAWKHLLVDQEPYLGRQVNKMSLWSRFRCALRSQLILANLRVVCFLLCGLRSRSRCAERWRAGRASLP